MQHSPHVHVAPHIQAWPTPIEPHALLLLHTQHTQRYPVLLQSIATNQQGEDYDLLLAFPGDRLTLFADGRLQAPDYLAGQTEFLSALDTWWQQEQCVTTTSATTIPFIGGWFLFLGYDLAYEIETHLAVHRLQSAQPTACIAQALRIPAAIVRHCRTGQAWIVTEPNQAALAAKIASDMQHTSIHAIPPATADAALTAEIIEEPESVFLTAVERALEYIAAGDIYQANLSRQWQAQLLPGVTAHTLYAQLCRTNPAPFMGLAQLDDLTLISSSPERLVEVRGDSVHTQPIAGTRPRAVMDAAEDHRLLNELRMHPKEHAEHVMLLDLERNDLGRICQQGTVVVDQYMALKSYQHVHHIVSNVRGQLRPLVTPSQVIAAVFPGGTITGCPKVRCMDIIAQLEPTPRGAYTGSMGYLNRDGSMDLNILIRTLTLHANTVHFRAGAGIVADSDPMHELAETRAKALGMIRALRPSA